MDIKKIIEERIKEHGISKKDFAERMGIHPANLNSMIMSPSFPTLTKIAETLGISLSELVSDGTNERPTSLRCPHCGKEIHVEIKS